MKAARIQGYKDQPRIEEIGTPDIGPDEVLIRVEAAALNPLDGKLQSGAMEQFFPLAFPYTLGTDLAGTIERVGASVAVWKVGDKVLARLDPPTGGALAAYAVAPASYCVAVPSSMTISDAAGLGTTAGTAWQALFEVANLKAGQTVLIHAGAGGVGSFAVQFAHAAGAKVIATASGDGVDLARKLGADQVVDYTVEDFTKVVNAVDVVLDLIGGETQTKSFEVLRSGGFLASTVMPPDQAMAAKHRVTAAFIFHNSDGARLKTIVDHLHHQSLKVLVDRTFPLSGIADAFERQTSGKAHGKVILLPEA